MTQQLLYYFWENWGNVSRMFSKYTAAFKKKWEVYEKTWIIWYLDKIYKLVKVGAQVMVRVEAEKWEKL